MVPLDRLNEIVQRFEYIEARMTQGGGDIAQLGREYAELRPVVEEIRSYRQALADLEAARALLDDPDLCDLAQAEIAELEARLPGMEAGLQLALLPRDTADSRAAILEIRPGTGGEEAALFAADLMRMYQRYTEARGWSFEVIEEQWSELGGLRELVARVGGEGVFARLKFESGVHRVQRVPETEAKGRVHTSAATVAVLPEVEEVDVHIDSGDLRIDTYRASGAGGQHVNKTDSAVRITHLPTGTVVACQDERSQIKNRAKAMTLLRSRIYEAEQRRVAAERAAERKEQVGTGDRSDRVRTYNFPQDRLTDHRLGKNFALAQVMEGKLEPIIAALQLDLRERRIADL